MRIVEVAEPGRTRVCLRGQFDLAGVPFVGDRLRRLGERGEAVLLDLDELEFIDMSGLRVVLAAAEEASRDGWEFAVTRGSPVVRRLAALVWPDGRLPCEERTG